MSDTLLFDHHIGRVKRLARIRALNQGILTAALLFLCAYTALDVFRRFVDQTFSMTPTLYAALAAGAGLAAILAAALNRRPFATILIDIDSRLRLRDRLSTAYEYRANGTSSVLLDLLVADAGQRLSALDRRQMLPFRWSWLHTAILIMLLLNAAVLGLDALLPEPEIAAPLNPEISEQIQRALERYAQQPEPVERDPETPRKQQQDLQQRLRHMTRQLEQQQLTRKQAMESVQKSLKEIQSQRDQLTEELGSNLQALDGIREIPIPNLSNAQQFSLQQSHKMQKMLSEALGGDLPPDVQESLAMLQHYNALESTLQDIAKHLATPEQQSSSGSETAQNQRGQQRPGSGQAGPGENDTPGSGQHRDDSDALSGQLPNGENRMADGQPGNQRMPGIEGENAKDQPGAANPGHSPGDGRQNPPSPLERSPQAPQQERMAPSKKADYNAQIRSVTRIGEAALPEQTVERAYEQDVEDVLHKEDMPPNYREYIKTYFLSIGLTERE